MAISGGNFLLTSEDQMENGDKIPDPDLRKLERNGHLCKNRKEMEWTSATASRRWQ